MASILLSVSAVIVQDSHANRNMDMTRERISLIFELGAILLSFQMVLSFASAAVHGLGDSGEDFRFRSFLCDHCSQMCEPVDAI